MPSVSAPGPDGTAADATIGARLLSSLPAVLRYCITEKEWWQDEMQGMHVINGRSNLALPAGCGEYRKIINAPSPRWRWQGTCARASDIRSA
jgi:hypothetical protein